jgi:hypothetical protein
MSDKFVITAESQDENEYNTTQQEQESYPVMHRQRFHPDYDEFPSLDTGYEEDDLEEEIPYGEHYTEVVRMLYNLVESIKVAFAEEPIPEPILDEFIECEDYLQEFIKLNPDFDANFEFDEEEEEQ